jgi:hypothetical protein
MSGSERAQTTAKRAGSGAEQTGRRVEDSKAFATLVRIGLIDYGVIHLLVAWIALQLAWTGTNQQASQQGAFRQLASNPVGDVVVWITAAGLFTLALWQVFEAIWGYQDIEEGRKRVMKRLGSACRTIVYIALGVSAAGTAAGSSSAGKSSNSSEQSLTAKLMSMSFGQILVIVVGLVIVVVGGRLVYRGITKKFTEELDGSVSSGIVRLGQIGYLAKGIALAIVGVLFVVAAVTFDPKKAGGLDAALRTLRDQPFGPVLLTLMALGIACYGVYCFAWSKHPRTS